MLITRAGMLGCILVTFGLDGPDDDHAYPAARYGLQEHDIHHRAQLILYRRLMGIEPPSI